MAINFATKYSGQIAKMFTHASFVKPHTNGKMDFTGVRTVKVYKLNTVEETGYQRSGLSRYGTPEDIQDTVFEYTMTQDRAFTGVVDKGDESDQTISNKAGQFLSAQVKEKSVPNADRYALRKFANFGKVVPVSAAPTRTTVVGLFADLQQSFDDDLVPEDGRIAYVSGAVYKLIALSDEFLKLEKLGEKSVARGEVGELFGFRIVKVPTSYLPKGCYFLAMQTSAVCMPYKISDTKVHKDPVGVSGAVIEGRYYYDAFVFAEKAAAVYAAVEAASKLPAVTIGGTAEAVTMTCSGAAVIQYTVDGSDPRFSDSAAVYSAAVGIGAGKRIRAVAFPAAKYDTDAGKFTGDIAEKTF